MRMIFFSSDQHLGHGKIIEHTNRPFANSWEMDEQLIANHNSIVGPNDKVFYGGDLSFRAPTGRVAEYLSRLNGKKYLIAGNHDKAILTRDKNFNIVVRPEIEYLVEWVKDYYELYVQDNSFKHGSILIVLSHYAMRAWNKSHRGSYHLYGHSHGSLPDDPNSLSIDIGVDAVAKRLSVNGVLNPKDYRPISYDEVKIIIQEKINKIGRK